MQQQETRLSVPPQPPVLVRQKTQRISVKVQWEQTLCALRDSLEKEIERLRVEHCSSNSPSDANTKETMRQKQLLMEAVEGFCEEMLDSTRELVLEVTRLSRILTQVHSLCTSLSAAEMELEAVQSAENGVHRMSDLVNLAILNYPQILSSGASHRNQRLVVLLRTLQACIDAVLHFFKVGKFLQYTVVPLTIKGGFTRGGTTKAIPANERTALAEQIEPPERNAIEVSEASRMFAKAFRGLMSAITAIPEEEDEEDGENMEVTTSCPAVEQQQQQQQTALPSVSSSVASASALLDAKQQNELIQSKGKEETQETKQEAQTKHDQTNQQQPKVETENKGMSERKGSNDTLQNKIVTMKRWEKEERLRRLQEMQAGRLQVTWDDEDNNNENDQQQQQDKPALPSKFLANNKRQLSKKKSIFEVFSSPAPPASAAQTSNKEKPQKNNKGLRGTKLQRILNLDKGKAKTASADGPFSSDENSSNNVRASKRTDNAGFGSRSTPSRARSKSVGDSNSNPSSGSVVSKGKKLDGKSSKKKGRTTLASGSNSPSSPSSPSPSSHPLPAPLPTQSPRQPPLEEQARTSSSSSSSPKKERPKLKNKAINLDLKTSSSPVEKKPSARRKTPKVKKKNTATRSSADQSSFDKLKQQKEEALRRWLHAIDPTFEDLVSPFIKERIYLEDLSSLSEQEFKELNIPLGARRKIIQTLQQQSGPGQQTEDKKNLLQVSGQHAQQQQQQQKEKEKRNKEDFDRELALISTINPDDLEFLKSLGNGAFGEVYMGIWRQTTTVAIKKLRSDVTMDENSRLAFLEEAKLMMKMPRHPNIVGCLGACVENKNWFLVMEYMPDGSLRQYLMDHPTEIDSKELLELAKGIAAGMDHLEAHQIVHRDLSLRNILLEVRGRREREHIAKVCDFGMAKSLQLLSAEEEQQRRGSYITRGGKIPLRWTAPEAIIHKAYTSKSDVWSFGVVLWELYSFGSLPYGELTEHRPGFSLSAQDLLNRLNQGYRMPCPEECPPEIYALMQDCWQIDPERRPSFREIFLRLHNAMEEFLSAEEKAEEERRLMVNVPHSGPVEITDVGYYAIS
ncbi:Ephrin type-A receptor 2 [Balamuthia mandrillaris]